MYVEYGNKDLLYYINEVSLSNLMGCARVKCGLLQGGTVIICLTQEIRSTVYNEYASIV